MLKYSTLQSSLILQAGVLVSHGLPIGENRNQSENIRKKICFGGEKFLTELIIGIRRVDLFVDTNFN